MSHTQHTPGPWEVSYRDLSVQIYGANGSGIGEVYGWSAGSQAVQQEAFANAHLIAAAPRLLSAAQRVTAAFRAMGQPASVVGLVSNLRAECEASMLELDEAIKQATGEAE